MPAGCSTKAVGSNHASGFPVTASSGVRPGARLGRSNPRPGPSDGAHCERERLARTNAVSGLPLRIWPITATCQFPSRLRASPSSGEGMSQVAWKTQLCLAW